MWTSRPESAAIVDVSNECSEERLILPGSLFRFLTRALFPNGLREALNESPYVSFELAGGWGSRYFLALTAPS